MRPADPLVPIPRVLVGDDGAPLVDDRVLAVAVRWRDQPLTLVHARPGRAVTPAEGVTLDWDGACPVARVEAPHEAWVCGEGGATRPAGRLSGLEAGEVLVVRAGQVTVEARLQRRAPGPEAAERRQENVFFGLVAAHTLMFAAAVVVALVITPRVETASIFGSPVLRRVAASPVFPVPKVAPPALAQRVDEVLTRATRAALAAAPAAQPARRSAADAVRLLLGGGGAFVPGLSSGIDAALRALSGGGPLAAEGPPGLSARSLGPGLDATGLSLGSLGPGRGRGPGGPGGPGGSLRTHEAVGPVCPGCSPVVTPGYDRDLVLKVVKRHQGEIRYCYEAELASAPDLAGKVTIAWTIGPTGQVDDAQVAESGLGNANVEACIVQRVRRWRFPEPAGGQDVAITFPWVFQVAGGGDD